jgi:hypothetical protein
MPHPSRNAWTQIATHANGYFVLLERVPTRATDWRNVKVERIAHGPGKRCWHAGFSKSEQRLSRSVDAALLAENHPELVSVGIGEQTKHRIKHA